MLFGGKINILNFINAKIIIENGILEKECFEILFSLEKDLPPHLKDTWRKLQTADHFYYMCTKWFADGDVHKYFNPYDNPYEAYLNFRNVLEDLKIRAKPNVKVHIRN